MYLYIEVRMSKSKQRTVKQTQDPVSAYKNTAGVCDEMNFVFLRVYLGYAYLVILRLYLGYVFLRLYLGYAYLVILIIQSHLFKELGYISLRTDRAPRQ